MSFDLLSCVRVRVRVYTTVIGDRIGERTAAGVWVFWVFWVFWVNHWVSQYVLVHGGAVLCWKCRTQNTHRDRDVSEDHDYSTLCYHFKKTNERGHWSTVPSVTRGSFRGIHDL